MKMVLDRLQKDSDVTISQLLVDDDFECWVCEDAVREIPGEHVSVWKIPGKTAIPTGIYDVVVTMSARFKKDLPLLVDVPGFSGVRIHPGNTPEDTEGCILPGLDRHAKSVGRSQLAFQALFTKIKEALAKGEKVTIEVM